MTNLYDIEYLKKLGIEDQEESNIVIFDMNRICRRTNDREFIFQKIWNLVLSWSEHKHVTIYIEDLGRYLYTDKRKHGWSQGPEQMALTMLSDSENIKYTVIATAMSPTDIIKDPFVFIAFAKIILMTPEYEKGTLRNLLSVPAVQKFADESVWGIELLRASNKSISDANKKLTIFKRSGSDLMYKFSVMDIRKLFED